MGFKPGNVWHCLRLKLAKENAVKQRIVSEIPFEDQTVSVGRKANCKMENKFIELFNKYPSYVELGMIIDIQSFFDGREDIKEYDLNVDETEKKLLLNIKLKVFSKWSAQKLFSEFVCIEGYDDINLYICEKEEQHVRYLYLTANQNFRAVKMEIAIK